MSTYVTKSLVLSVKPWREGDKLYTLLTELYGKIEVVAAGSRRVSSKLSPHLLPFSEINVMIARGRIRDRLASADLLQVYIRPPYELPKILLASALLEVAESLTRFGQSEYRAMDLLRQSLSQLALLSSSSSAWHISARRLLADYLIEFFKLTGLTLTLTKCERCHRPLSEDVYFSWSSHSFYHQIHVPPGETIVPLTQEVLAWLLKASNGLLKQNDAVPLTALDFLTDYFTGHAGHQFYTLKVFRSIL